jgi:hypothetical protein
MALSGAEQRRDHGIRLRLPSSNAVAVVVFTIIDGREANTPIF